MKRWKMFTKEFWVNEPKPHTTCVFDTDQGWAREMMPTRPGKFEPQTVLFCSCGRWARFSSGKEV